MVWTLKKFIVLPAYELEASSLFTTSPPKWSTLPPISLPRRYHALPSKEKKNDGNGGEIWRSNIDRMVGYQMTCSFEPSRTVLQLVLQRKISHPFWMKWSLTDRPCFVFLMQLRMLGYVLRMYGLGFVDLSSPFFRWKEKGRVWKSGKTIGIENWPPRARELSLGCEFNIEGLPRWSNELLLN